VQTTGIYFRWFVLFHLTESKLKYILFFVIILQIFLVPGCKPDNEPSINTIRNLPRELTQSKENIIDGKLLYHSNSTGRFHIYLHTTEESERRILSLAFGSDVEPTWSPTGEDIAFAAYTTDLNNIQIYIMSADKKEKRLLTSDQPRLNWRPAWSNDGTFLFFQTNRDGNYEIYRSTIDGNEVINLSENSANDADPNCSPNGKYVFFTSDRGGSFDIYRMNLDGSKVVKILECPQGCALPKTSPGGDRLVFISDMDGDGTKNLYLLYIKQDVVTQLTNRGSEDSSPYWMNENRILFSGVTETGWDIFMLDIAEKQLQQITSGSGDEKFPSWIP